MKKRVLRFGGDKVEKDILERLYRRHTKAVYLYLYSLCHDHALAEDLMQETFLRAFCTLELSETAILPWLLMVARNLYYDIWRKEKRLSPYEVNETEGQGRAQRRKGAGESGMNTVRGDGEGILDLLIQKERNQKLYRTIQKLKSTEKEAVVLYYFAGLSQEEIGKILGVSYGNIRVILYRAKKNLKSLLVGEEMLV